MDNKHTDRKKNLLAWTRKDKGLVLDIALLHD